MSNGRIVELGTFAELTARGIQMHTKPAKQQAQHPPAVDADGSNDSKVSKDLLSFHSLETEADEDELALCIPANNPQVSSSGNFELTCIIHSHDS